MGKDSEEHTMTFRDISMSERMENIKSALGDKYEIKNLITCGGMAEIYLGVHIGLNKRVVIKVVRNDLAGSACSRERFCREAKLAANLDHPVIIDIYDFGYKDEFDYIIMPYIEGLTLKERIEQKGKLGLPECLRLVIILTDALCFAHNGNVIHRDIKPSNIMIDRAGHIFLADFGISKDLSDVDLTASDTVLGTPKYMSPEQIQGLQADRRSDLYSLGLVFYEIITGEYPFGGKDVTSLCYAHVHETPREPGVCCPDIPHEVAEIIMKLLEKSPEQRYQDACELLEDLEKINLKTIVGPQRDSDETLAETAVIQEMEEKKFLPKKKVVSKTTTIILVTALIATFAILGILRLPERDQGAPTTTKSDKAIVSYNLQGEKNKHTVVDGADTTSLFDSVVDRILALGKGREAAFLRIYLDKPKFAVGDPISYHFESDRDCYLVILTLTSTGDLVQIFPNKYSLNNFVQANKKYRIPEIRSDITLEVAGPPGQEEIVALAAEKPFSLLPSSFESQPFFQLDRDNQGVLAKITQNLQTANQLSVSQKRATYWITGY